jgi:hypothetical protein
MNKTNLVLKARVEVTFSVFGVVGVSFLIKL